MKIKELIKKLKLYNPEDIILVSSDEELNTLYGELEVASIGGEMSVIYGLDGSIVEDFNEETKKLSDKEIKAELRKEELKPTT